MNVLILGISGMLGSSLYRYLSSCKDLNIYGTSRDLTVFCAKFGDLKNIIQFYDYSKTDKIESLVKQTRPDIIINCIGVIKQTKNSNDPIHILPINSLLPHHLYNICNKMGIRLIHFSTDCVFKGNKGDYKESDERDANDLYGLSKKIGEINKLNALTIRTSIIGHEIRNKLGLLEWFLKQKGNVKGFKNVYFSGLPTIEIGEILNNYILKNTNLHGILHISGPKISKFDLLTIISTVYKKHILITPDFELNLDRSLDSSKFEKITSYKKVDWEKLIIKMKNFN